MMMMAHLRCCTQHLHATPRVQAHSLITALGELCAPCIVHTNWRSQCMPHATVSTTAWKACNTWQGVVYLRHRGRQSW